MFYRAAKIGILLAVGCSTAPRSAPPVTPVRPASGPHASNEANPFIADDAPLGLYVSPERAIVANTLAAAHPAEAIAIRKLATLPTAIWLSSIADVSSVARHLEQARAQSVTAGKVMIPVFVIYNLPARDCAAAASNGELSLKDEGRYQREYIDAIADHFRAHPKQRIVAVVEPDSLANLATNLGVETCAAAEGAYRRGVAYAIAQLSLPNVFLYLDAAHGGWLGWPKNLTAIAKIFTEVLASAGGADRIRGFAVNVSNYNPVLIDGSAETAKLNTPPAHPTGPGQDEIAYIADLARVLASVGIRDKGYVVDTSRNGRTGIRSTSANWCNIAGAGLGERPRVAAPGSVIDALLWVKVPGESDGVADPTAPRFDRNCASADAAPGAPQAGELFPEYLVDLVKNARPPL